VGLESGERRILEYAMPSEHPDIPILDLSGTPEQIGSAHGEAQRPRIRAYVERFLDWLTKTAAISLTEQSLWSRWAVQVAANQSVAPGLIEEMRGISRGAGVPFERIFLLNSLLDLNSFRYLGLAGNFAGCTTFAVVAEAGTGRTLAGQTYDMPAFHQDYLTLLRLRPAQGPRQLIFTFAGIVGAAGLNEAGIALNINYLSPRDVGLGRLHSVVVRQVLAAHHLADALEPAVLPPRAGGAHFLVADRDGNILSLETTARSYAVLYPRGNAIGHTNHYLTGTGKAREYLRPGSIGSSLARHAALRRYLQEHQHALTVEKLKELTRSHTSYPRSICAHGAESDQPDRRSRTVAALVQVPAEGSMSIVAGCACENEYHTVTL
jgi:isopenicillin-N N-acyltransferase-like protein